MFSVICKEYIIPRYVFDFTETSIRCPDLSFRSLEAALGSSRNGSPPYKKGPPKHHKKLITE